MKSNNIFEVSDLHAKIAEKEILKGVNLSIKKGETHVIMGPNGSGKSTFSNTIMGHPIYEVTKGEIFFEGKKITDLAPDERAKIGIFMAFQYPREISGVTLEGFLRESYLAVNRAKDAKFVSPSVFKFRNILKSLMKDLSMDESFLLRYVNKGFSGGEKKKAEILHMLVLDPDFVILDETDSGLDVDALKIVFEGVKILKDKGKTVLLITHYQRVLTYIHADHVHVMVDGKISKSGGKEFAEELEKKGYKGIK